MLYPVMPLFVTGVLGASPIILGLIDGIAEGGSSVLRWVAGALSDRFRRRKPFVVGGYSLSAASKPLMGFAAHALGWPLFFAGRLLDRIGKSIRTSARDALIADSTPGDRRGAAFGLHRAMDTLGAVVGPLTALLLMTMWPALPLAWLFFAAFVPGFLSALLALVAVREMPHEPGRNVKPPPIFQPYPRPLWCLIFAVCVFSLGNSSDSFLILRSKELGLSFGQVVLAYALYNLVYALGALPLGRLSDRIGRKPLVAAGWAMYAAVYLGFALAKTPLAPWALFTLYGLYQALAEGVSKALVSDVVPTHQRAGAIGLFYTAAGLGQMVASLIAGLLWARHVGPFHAPFLVGSLAALGAVPLLAAVRTARRNGRRG
jgi:MFS family permease